MTARVPGGVVKWGLTGALAVSASMITYFEGRSLIAYLDPVGIPTICDGIIQGVMLGDVRTPEQCDAALVAEVRRKAAAVDKYVRVPVSPNTYAALVSFVYNIGEGNFRNSTALRKINAGDTAGGCDAMRLFVCGTVTKGTGARSGPCANVKRDKILLRGLVRRREAERALCLQFHGRGV